MKKLFTRDDALPRDPNEVRLHDYCQKNGIEPDQIHEYPSFDIDWSDGSIRLFRCKGKIYLAEYSCGVYEDLYEVSRDEASKLLENRVDRFLRDL